MTSPNIVAIGGGGVRPSAELLGYGVELAGAESQPKVLYVPTAKINEAKHVKSTQLVRAVFEDGWGLPFDVLHEFGTMPSKDEVEHKLGEADMLYISGGDARYMMDVWRQHGVDQQLRQRILGGLVVTGISAGAIAPFTWGLSDTEHYRVADGQPWSYRPVEALGIVPAAMTPHFDTFGYRDTPRAQAFTETLESGSGPIPRRYGFGIDDKAAILIHDDILEIKTRDPMATVMRFDTATGSIDTMRHDDTMVVADLSDSL